RRRSRHAAGQPSPARSFVEAPLGKEILGEVAQRAMVDLRRDVWRRCGRADLLSILAPGMEPTTGGGRQKAWRASRNRFETAALTLDARERSKETLGVRVESTTEDVVPGTLLDDLPGIHDRNPIRHLRDDGDIVGDDDDRHMKA